MRCAHRVNFLSRFQQQILYFSPFTLAAPDNIFLLLLFAACTYSMCACLPYTIPSYPHLIIIIVVVGIISSMHYFVLLKQCEVNEESKDKQHLMCTGNKTPPTSPYRPFFSCCSPLASALFECHPHMVIIFYAYTSFPLPSTSTSSSSEHSHSLRDVFQLGRSCILFAW